MIDRTFTIEIAAPIQTVWDEFTKRGSPHEAMFSTYLNGDLTPGSVMTYRNRSGTHTFVLGKLLEVDAPTRLVHTFRFSMEDDAPTLVEWSLEPLAAKLTRVTVRHSRFEGETRTYKSVSTSWPAILRLYKQKIETGRAPLGVRIRNGLMMAISFMLPKKARTDVAVAQRLDVD